MRTRVQAERISIEFTVTLKCGELISGYGFIDSVMRTFRDRGFVALDNDQGHVVVPNESISYFMVKDKDERKQSMEDN
jgi:hypothetical protein